MFAPLWRRVLHYIILILLVLTCVHKLLMVILAFTIIPVGTEVAVLSYAGFTIQITAMSTGLGFVFFPRLSCELLNCWDHILSETASRLGQSTRTPWTYASSSFQVLFVGAGLLMAVVVMSASSLLFPTIPTSLFTSLRIAGLIDLPDDNSVATITARIICFLFDISIYMLVLPMLGFSIQYIVSEIGVLKVVINSLR